MKLPSLHKIAERTGKQRTLFITLIIVAGIVSLVALKVTDKKEACREAEPLTLSLLMDKSYLRTVMAGPPGEKEIILVEASKILLYEIHTVTDTKHEDFILDDFADVIPVIDFMLAIDPENGHAIYFKGEVYRLLNDHARFLEYFQRYLETENSIGSQLPWVTDPQKCYETPHGYCEQRTAWISQLLANYYYKLGLGEPDYDQRIRYFSIAREYIQNVRVHYPPGFITSAVTISTVDLETKLKACTGY